MLKIMRFLKQEVPGEKTKLAAWRKKASELGDEAPAVCREVLKSGKSELHYAAILVLRTQGYEAQERGYGNKTTYRIKSPTSRLAEVIRPLHHFPDLEPAAKWMPANRAKVVASRNGTSRKAAAMSIHSSRHSLAAKSMA